MVLNRCVDRLVVHAIPDEAMKGLIDLGQVRRHLRRALLGDSCTNSPRCHPDAGSLNFVRFDAPHRIRRLSSVVQDSAGEAGVML